ncbi:MULTISPECIES: methyltransferase family protein [unclassified Flavobacterium]|jgi:protein-S-isoprenylcysteine O-methyltransferase Ste14|uniref:methyltransferase family protein n=2 Tax=Flavobacterium TaxID=237 RepID=UPI0025C561E3|nr:MULTISPECIES: isoprenylcysteine carboxylmethyltransferase family protein [unclassified Flavobacterium]
MTVKRKDYLFVTIQFILFFCFIFDFNWSMKLSFGIQKTGLWIAVFGGIIIILALLQLNKNLSPFPTPKEKATLLQTGLYKYIRHPIYTGIMILFLGYSLYQNSLYKLGISLFLVVLFHFKSNYEEHQLALKFPDYKLYKIKTGKFLPKFNNHV